MGKNAASSHGFFFCPRVKINTISNSKVKTTLAIKKFEINEKSQIRLEQKFSIDLLFREYN